MVARAVAEFGFFTNTWWRCFKIEIVRKVHDPSDIVLPRALREQNLAIVAMWLTLHCGETGRPLSTVSTCAEAGRGRYLHQHFEQRIGLLADAGAGADLGAADTIHVLTDQRRNAVIATVAGRAW